MKYLFCTIATLAFLFCNPCFSQKNVNGVFKFKLSNGYSENPKVPLILEEAYEKKEVLYAIDGKEATRKVKSFRRIKKDTAIIFGFPHLIITPEQDGDKLVLNLEGEAQEAFEKYNNGKDRRLVIDITKGVKIKKVSKRFNAFTIPLKVYLSDRSDSLVSLSNNIETNVNGGITFGISEDYYIFQKGKDPKLANTFGLFGYIGLNKLNLNFKNTDGKNEDNDILSVSYAVGIQVGYGRVNTGLLFGIDSPASDIGDNWVFRTRPWIGIGVGYSLSD